MTDLEKQISRLNFAVEKSLRYHQRRRAHYDRWHRWIMLGVIVLGSTGFADIIGAFGRAPGIWSAMAALTVAALAAIDLVFDLSVGARNHELLHWRFSRLASNIRAAEQPSEKDY